MSDERGRQQLRRSPQIGGRVGIASEPAKGKLLKPTTAKRQPYARTAGSPSGGCAYSVTEASGKWTPEARQDKPKDFPRSTSTCLMEAYFCKLIPCYCGNVLRLWNARCASFCGNRFAYSFARFRGIVD